VSSSLVETVEQRRALRDAKTGGVVWQMTSSEADNVAPYMYCQAMTPDERYVCFESNRAGFWQPFRLEVKTGLARPLSDSREYHAFSLNMRGSSSDLLFLDGLRVCAVDVPTAEARVLADLSGRADVARIASICVTDNLGGTMALHFVDAEKRHGIGMVSLKDGRFDPVFLRGPGEEMQHILINPAYPDLVSFAVWPDYQNERTGTAERRARAWLLDARTGKARPNLVMSPGFRATHEYWAHDGRRLYCHKKTVGPGPGVQWIPTWINSIARDGGDEREHFRSDTLYLGHSCVNRAETRIVSDEQRSGGQNVLMDIDARRGTGEVLCWPNLELKNPIGCHVHPSLSPSERFVVYTSNVTGRAQVYMTPLGDAVIPS
jgi:hypothetical protein